MNRSEAPEKPPSRLRGIIFGIEGARKKIQVIGAEPLLGNDAARSLKA